MSIQKYLNFRGDIRALAATGSSLAFVTVHPEGLPSALYRVDAEKVELNSEELPAGSVAIAIDGDVVWVAGSDRKIYRVESGKKPAAVSVKFEADLQNLVLLSNHRLAVLSGEHVVVLNRKKKKLVQTLELPEAGTAIAVAPTGDWLTVGTTRGNVLVFQSKEQEEFALSESAKLHEGAVTALLFEPEELRFLSAGMDQKLLLTHARGQLEPEDRGRGANHSDQVTAMVHVPGERFVTGSADKSLKTWTLSGGTRPATLTDGVVRVVDLAMAEVHGRPHIVAACSDNSLRVWLMDASGRFGQATLRIFDAYEKAVQELEQSDVRRREAALRELASLRDARSLEILGNQVDQDSDAKLRQLATELIADSGHARGTKLLEGAIKHHDEAVRLAALSGLRKLIGESDLRPLDLALNVGKADVGQAAVEALRQLASKDELAFAKLTGALDAKPWAVRRAALLALETLHKKGSSEAHQTALKSKHSDIRRHTLARLFERKLIDQPAVQSAVRRHLEDKDIDVRQTAFLISLQSRPSLAKAIRERDRDIHRQMFELESFQLEAEDSASKAETEKGRGNEKVKELPKTRKTKIKLDPQDYEPLLQAMASRSLVTCLLGARCLALLEDPRAFGMLLQLSREEHTQSRVQVCQAFSALSDPRCVGRLRTMLNDGQSEVRDAAFTALARVLSATPLVAAEAGLGASHQDVHQRGLQLLTKVVKADLPASTADPGWELMQRALNDQFDPVRSEAFKTTLNLNLGGGGAATLRFALGSIHADVRREVLTEVMAQTNEAWAWELLLDLFSDPDSVIRKEAFEFAVKKTKGRDLKPLESALESNYPDIRKLGTAELIKKNTAAAQALLVRAIDDADSDVRQSALSALMAADAEEALLAALQSDHADIRVRAAFARARHGDGAALPPLLALAMADEPEHDDERAFWKKHVVAACQGIAELGDAAGVQPLNSLLSSDHSEVRAAAARALAWTATEDSTLRTALQHEDDTVKSLAAFGLALQGDPVGSSLIFAHDKSSSLKSDERLIAASSLGSAGEDQLLTLLDDKNDEIRRSAFIVLAMLDWLDHDGTPRRITACLSAVHPRARLQAAQAVESFGDSAAMHSFIQGLLNERPTESAWEIPMDTVAAFAELALGGTPHTRARTLQLLGHLKEEKQDAWNLAWEVHAGRFKSELNKLEKAARKRKLKTSFSDEDASQLSFGTYVGLVREQGETHRNRSASDGPLVIRIRQTALSRLLKMAQANESAAGAARPVFIQAIGDANRQVRAQAFEHLQELGIDSATLAAEALETGWNDLGVEGLKLLTKGAKAAEAKRTLEHVMLSRDDELSIEAAKLLVDRSDVVSVSKKAIDAVHAPLRSQAIIWLTEQYDDNAKARKLLADALKSRHEEVRWQAAQNLATKKDAAAFDALVTRLNETVDKGQQRQTIVSLERLGDERGPDVLIDRVVNDASGTAQVKLLLKAVGGFYLTASVDRLLELMEKKAWRDDAFHAVRTISGHNQRIDDPDDELPDRSWEDKQRPRHDDVLSRLMNRCLELGEVKKLTSLLPAARWSRSDNVNSVLATITSHPDDELRRRATEVVGFRLRKRGVTVELMLPLLEHRDAETKFLAAEGLARAGHADGISILLSAIDLMTDLQFRYRAVSALGELGDERSLEVLLKLANEDAHALQEEAVEAIGHLAQSEQADDILKLLSRFAKSGSSLAERAIRGLRWFDTPDGWQIVREHANDEEFDFQSTAIEMLGYNDDPVTVEVLLRTIVDGEAWIADQAYQSCRRLLGDESLEPDYAWIKSEHCYADSHYMMDRSPEFRRVDRVGRDGDADRILDAIGNGGVVDGVLQQVLLRREPLPVEEAAAELASQNEITVCVAASILGRAGSSAAKQFGKAVSAALSAWLERRDAISDGKSDDNLDYAETCVSLLMQAAGRLGVADAHLIDIIECDRSGCDWKAIRRVAAMQLTDHKPKAAGLKAIEAAISDRDPCVRQLATSALARYAPKKALEHADSLVSDRHSFDRLAESDVKVNNVVANAAGQLNSQGVVLPYLVAEANHKSLATVAADGELSEAARMGAIEALAQMGKEPAEKELVKIGNSESFDEELRKAAWRGLRRSKRSRQKAEA